MFGWNARISLASVVMLTRLAAASGLLGWIILMMAAHNSQDQAAGKGAGDGVGPERETIPTPLVAGPPEVLFSFATAGGWATQAMPMEGSRILEQDESGPGRLPQLPGSGSQRAEEMGELLALRARVGTGLGDEGEFRAALAALFEQEGESPRGPAVVAAPAETAPRSAEVIERAAVPRSAGGANFVQPGLPAPVWNPPGPAFQRQWNPPGPGAPVAGFAGPTFQGQGMPSESSAARIRVAARAIEEAAWELEQVGEYGLADDLRRQAQGIYMRARRAQSVEGNRAVYGG
jgi:hypothetical protein